jgi:hypothetical protein
MIVKHILKPEFRDEYYKTKFKSLLWNIQDFLKTLD